MNRKTRALLLVSLSGIGASGCGPTYSDSDPTFQGDSGAESQTAQVALNTASFATQQQSEWCWAATVSNVFAYYGHPVSQARIVSEVYGTVANVRSGPYSQTASLLNRDWIDDNGVAFRAQLSGVYDEMAGVRAFDNNRLRDELKANHPILIGTTEHAKLVVGMNYRERGGNVFQVTEVDVFDPWPGIGFRALNVTESTLASQGGSLMFVADALVTP